MQRISTEQDGIFKDGVPGLTRGTKLNAAWFNALQEEVCNLLEGNGISLNPSVNTQLKSLFQETLDRVFKSPVSVQDPENPGTETTIDAGFITIHGVELRRTEVENVVWLIVNECVSIVKNLHVDGALTVHGGADFDGWIKALAYGVMAKGITAIEGLASQGDLSVNGHTDLNTVFAKRGSFQMLYSLADATQEYGGTDDVEIGNSLFSAVRRRYRAIILSGASGHPQRTVNITAMPSDGFMLHVENIAVANDGFVFVKWNQTNLCVLGPGSGRWFTCSAGAWVADRHLVG